MAGWRLCDPRRVCLGVHKGRPARGGRRRVWASPTLLAREATAPSEILKTETPILKPSERNTNMEVILLELVAKLGQMGEVVRVRDGFARNFLLKRGKALRATTDNRAKSDGMKRSE